MTDKGAQAVEIHELDATGEICPYPLVMTQRAVKKLKVGERLLIKVDYPKSSEDIPRWAEEAGHKVLEVKKTGPAQWEILLEKGE